MQNERMTVRSLISALQKLNPEATVVINIKQSNQRFGKQVYINDTSKRDSRGEQFFVTPEYGGCCITTHLPDGAYIAKFS